jgi:KDO2-lipid IV(A) lauroyltransferase
MRRLGKGVLRALILVRDFFLTACVLLIAAPLWLLPWAAAGLLGEFYGRVAGLAWPLARRAGMINLRRAFGPSLDRRTAGRWIGDVFSSLGRGIAEGIQFARRSKHGAAWRERCVAEDPDLESRIFSDPRPKIFVTGHLGSWEVAMATAALRSGSPGAAIARRVDNPFLNAVVRRVRLRRESEWIEKRGGAGEALARIRRGENVAMLLDENGGPRGIFVEFFGRAASTHKTPALLAALTGAPIVVGAAIRRSNAPFLFKLAVIEPRRAVDLAPPEAEIRRLTSEIAAVFESWVREFPRQWRWVHWRWRDRPDGTSEAYRRLDLEECFQDVSRAPSWKPGFDAGD